MVSWQHVNRAEYGCHGNTLLATEDGCHGNTLIGRNMVVMETRY